MKRWTGKVAVVTGASSGIGSSTASALVGAGVKVVGLGRRKDRLEALAKTFQNSSGTFHPFEADLTKEEDILKAFEYAKTVGPIHVLINSAGLANTATLSDGTTQSWREIFDVNVLALTIATREAIRDMKANDVNGHVVHINSLAGHRVAAGLPPSVYFASKYAVTALTETLRQELNSLGSKIKVTSISPGYVETEFQAVSGLRDDPVRVKYLNSMRGLQAEDVADAVVYVLGTAPHVQVHEIMMRSIEQKS